MDPISNKPELYELSGKLIMPVPNEIQITIISWELMFKDILEHLPDEACGLAAGNGRNVVAIFPVENMLHSPQQFRMEPRQQLLALQAIERDGLELLAIYHSHPEGPSYPSESDLVEAFYSGSAFIIWSPGKGGWNCNAYRLESENFVEIPIILV